jgi:predicted RNA binding protein YcfA (HicA-like mRNA interferase family)
MMITNHNSDKILVVLTKHYGFVIDRISNSHFQLNHPDGRRVTVPRHNRIKPGVIKSIAAQVHTTQEEFLKHS